MRILASLFTFSLLEGLLARGIPEYDQCVEKCGEDPLDDPVESIRYDACRDKCVEDGLNLCLGEIIDANRRRRCLREARNRCTENCGEDGDCIQFCRTFFS
ncbi:hypothetical protein CRM22_010282 [Opisthorchis felineus]|uniref:Uncharacterized protein n=1 Tax=Opisthorchis felineus TaxID=147828 RepID=A0A4S2L0A7_OPIFE|nr:hypothetical protein CRM22_010282 [Opisthorchis felineus]TGZ55880.1 hypothetical protein CRM22_010282 [Opisthorchis felineus]